MPNTKNSTTQTSAAETKIQAPFNKSELLAELVQLTHLTKKQVGSVLDGLSTIIHRHLQANSVGEFTLPGLIKLKVGMKPATPEREGVNPFTGKKTMFASKPERKTIKIKALKKLKDMAE